MRESGRLGERADAFVVQPRADRRQADPHEAQRTLEVVRGLSMPSRCAFMRSRPRLEYALLL